MPRLKKGERAPRAEDRKWSYWTQEEDAIIREGCEIGSTLEEIANSLGPHRTRGAVAGRASRLKISTKNNQSGVAKGRVTKTLIKAGVLPPGKQPVVRAHAPRARVGTPDTGYAKGVNSALPFVITKKGALLHVYSRDPYTIMPLATYERRGNTWVRRGDESERHDSARKAAVYVADRLMV